ncbi:MAG: hypothetical protein IPK33_11195 [Gemmatimonadetes bacterium]|jgi:hypothetical protein|nr:hypothetical protein [Gemmatimonadota bacterium]
MRVSERNRLQVLRRLRDFLKPMAEEPTLTAVLAELDDVIERMTAEAERQDSNAHLAKIGTRQVAALAQSLRLDLVRPVLRLVRRVAPDALTTAGSALVSLKLPKGEDRQALITAANAVYQTAKQYEDKLTAAGLPKDHLAKLLVASDALRDAMDTRAQRVLERGAAATTTAAQGRRSMEIVHLIDALVVPLLRGDAGKLRAWGAAKRLGYRGAGSTGTAEGEVAAVVPAVAPAVGVLSGVQTAADQGAGEVTKAA